MTCNLLRAAALIAAFLVSTVAPATAATGVARLVFEKSAKMKKIDATLYLGFDAGEKRALRCGVVARGKSGAIPVAGTLGLRLLGESAGGAAAWRSGGVAAAVDPNGDAWFTTDEISELVASAPGDAEIRLVEVGFRGGRGGRATELTVDCLREEGG